MQLLNISPTTAQAGQVGPVLQVRGSPTGINASFEAIFTYGSGGTSADVYVQTSFDGGTTWVDICNFHFTTASASKLFNL